MGVTRKVLKQGNGTDKPKKGDEVTIEYTGNLYDEKYADNDYRGEKYALKRSAVFWITINILHFHRFDSSATRGPFKTKIGVGMVIRGKGNLF